MRRKVAAPRAFGILDAGPIAVLYAATRPDRTSALILGNTTARFMQAPDYAIGASEQQAEEMLHLLTATWGTPEFMKFTNPGIDRESASRMARAQRAAMTPRTASKRYRYMWWNMDVREILPSIQVPTLVLHGKQLSSVPFSHGRFLAAGIPGAMFVPFEGGSSGIFVDQPDLVIDEVAELLTGEAAPTDMNKVLTTVLVTDIVSSTDQVATIGDSRWRGLLDAHDAAVREQLRRWRGREVNTTGDGFVACFDGPARRFAAHANSTAQLRISASRCAPACIPANVSFAATTSAVSQFTSRRGSARWPARAKCSCRRRCAISSRDRASTSKRVGNRN